MKKFLWLICLCYSLQGAAFEEEVSVADEAFPRNPTPLQEKEPTLLIDHLNGMVLSGDQVVEPAAELEKVRGVEFIHLSVPGRSDKLKRKLQNYIGSKVTTETLFEIRRTISDYYTSSGHPFVIVEVPQQEVTSGVLQVMVLESRLGKVKIEGNRWNSAERLKEYVKLQPNQEIDQNRLLQNVSFMNRNPFRRVDVVYAPGEQEGTTDVILAIKDRRSYRIYAGAENTGVEPTGRGRWYTGLNWGNVFGLGHIFSYQFTSALNVHRFYAHTAEYIAFLNWGHVLDVYGGYSKVHPKVHRPFKRNDGWSMQASGRYTIPLPVSRYLEHEVSFGGDFKRTNNTFEFSDDLSTFGKNVNLTQLVLMYSGNYERNTFKVDFNGNLYWSPGKWLSDQTNADYDSLRPGAKNYWVYFRGAFVYLQRLPKAFSLSLSAQGQVSSEPLLPSEQFGLGGYDTVRGYDQREVNKDDAICLSGEVRSPAIPIIRKIKTTWKLVDALQFLVFLDYGWGIDIDTLPGGKKSNYLLGTGPEIRYTLEPYLTFRLDWGIKLHKEASYGGGNTMIHFNITASY
ncbi:ShlB/FhaC/HecB family hemolysin secretion/activation protein [Simkania sp.]|uniref:ShlB/FhaC/HecB family hemolysin secretion/activation protein n=1 Tax=Simkania sp. TaxID=34094 RepID=UPI003B51D7FC